jgi:predicted dehydrogenase
MVFIPYFSIHNRLAAWDLVQAIQEGREPRASAADAAAVLEIIQGIYLSQLEGRRIEFPLTNRRHPLEPTNVDQP